MLRRELPRGSPQLQFFFQPADIVDQVLNFGQPAPIDVRISGPIRRGVCARLKIARALTGCGRRGFARFPGAERAGAHRRRGSHARRPKPGVTQQEAADNVLVATNSSAQTAPNFWVDPRNSVSYPLVVQVPTYRIGFAGSRDHAGDLRRGGRARATAA
jgi:predicted small lipoprotein YifL